MAYDIQDIANSRPDDFPFYFFDTNTWIAVLKNSGRQGIESFEQPYIDFFDAVIHLHTYTDPKLRRRINHQPKLVVTSLLLAELFNAYLHHISMRVYYVSKGLDPSDYKFKEHYRKTPDYQKELRLLISNFTAFKDYIELRDDRFKEIDPFSILPSLSETSDFNDFFYYVSFRDSGIPIVTHDKDFIFENITIITANKSLLNSRRNR